MIFDERSFQENNRSGIIEKTTDDGNYSDRSENYYYYSGRSSKDLFIFPLFIFDMNYKMSGVILYYSVVEYVHTTN